MVKACIGLGSNLGDRRKNILQAWSRLGENKWIDPLALSSPYESEPVGMESTSWFINAVGSFLTSLQPRELLTEMLKVEASLGRKRSQDSCFEDRTIDLDLLYWDEMISNDLDLILPHPEIARRLFVLVPLVEIEPDLLHPVSKKSSVEMLHQLLATHPPNKTASLIQKTSWCSSELRCST